MSKKFPRLYAKASNGKIKTWMIEAKDSTMIESWGYLDGKIQEQKKEIKGKNIGRANETTPEQQCELECQSKWTKKCDEQYTSDKNNIREKHEHDILLPMLAQRYQDRSHNIHFPCYVQPKLNGVRCIYQDGKFISRGGKEYTFLDHLVPYLKKLDIAIPDGEIYIHGMSLQQITSLVKKDCGEATDQLEYWIYDQINKNSFEKRIEDIDTRFEILSEGYTEKDWDECKLNYVDTFVVNSEKEIKKYHDEFVQLGFEGVIIRNTDGLYQVDVRSKDLQKYKEFIDEEFEISGGHEGSGPDAGTVVFECITKDGKPFSARPRGTREMRRKWFADIKKMIGKKLTVRYQQLTDDGIPEFPVAVCVRDYE